MGIFGINQQRLIQIIFFCLSTCFGLIRIFLFDMPFIMFMDLFTH